MTTRLPEQGWLASPPVRRIMAALDTVRPGCALFVGGCVRDALLERSVSDIDIATQLPPDVVAREMAAAGFSVHPTGIEHGTITVVVDHKPFEVTTLRRDVSTDGRRATVCFTDDWAEDAQRRDFRMNALYSTTSGEVLDPTGGGLDDIARRRVVFVGDPDTRIREDYLRVLRFFRFNAWYADASPEPEGLEACARGVGGLGGLSAERVWAETRKLLAAPDPRRVLFAMDSAGVLGALYPWALGLGRLVDLIAEDVEAGEPPDPIVRLMSMTDLDRVSSEAAIQRLKLSNVEAGRLRRAVGAVHVPRPAQDLPDLRRSIHRIGMETAIDLVRFAGAGSGNRDAWRNLLARVRSVRLPPFPVTGADIVGLGIPPGPEVGRWMRELEARWIASDFRDDRERLLDAVRGGL